MNFIETSNGKFGRFGGCFAPELLQPVLKKVDAVFQDFKKSPELQAEFSQLLKTFAGRPTPIYQAKNFNKASGGNENTQIWVKREDLLHGGAHKTNNVIGQALLAREMGATELIAETGAGQHGIASAMAAAHFGLPLKVFMGAKDVARQAVNVERMKLLGAEVISVDTGSASLKDAINEAMRYWISHSENTYYLFGTAAGPAPFPEMVSLFHRVIGDEARAQILEAAGQLPDEVLACVGGGSNAIGIFQAFFGDQIPGPKDLGIKLVGVEPAGDGIHHGLTIGKGTYGCLHGSLSKVNQTKIGQIEESHSISAGLDYPGVSPIHAYLDEVGNAEYVGATDDEAMKALLDFSRSEGIIPALESSHALAEAGKRVAQYAAAGEAKILLVNLSGRGDKDLHTVFDYLEKKMIKLENYFGFCLFGGGLLGFLFPDVFTGAQPYLPYFLMLGLFLGFLRVDWNEVVHLKTGGPRLAVYALISTILLPSVFFFLTPGLPYELRLGMFLMLATAAGANAPLIISFLHLRILWAAVFVTMTSLLVTISLPLMTAIFFKANIDIDVLGMMVYIGKIIIIPAILAGLLRAYGPSLAQKIQTQAGNIGTLNITFFMAVLVSLNAAYIQESGISWLTLYAIVGMSVILCIKFMTGFLLPAKSSDERWTNGLMFVIINNSLVILLAAEFLTPEIFWITLLSQIPWILAFPTIRMVRNKFIITS